MSMSKTAEVRSIVDVDMCGREAKKEGQLGDEHGQKSEAHYIKAGEWLIKAKASLPHGQWLPFLARHGINERTAQKWVARIESPEQHERDVELKRERRADANTSPLTHSTPAAQPVSVPIATPSATATPAVEVDVEMLAYQIKGILPGLSEDELVEALCELEDLRADIGERLKRSMKRRH